MFLKTVKSFLDEINSTNSTLEKKDVLRKYNKDEILKKVLYYTYNPMIQFNITSTNIDKYSKNKGYNEQNFTNYHKNDLFLLLDDLNTRKITGHEALKSVNEYIKKFNQEDREIIFLTIDKSLKTRTSVSVINDAIPGLIPIFEPVLAKDYDPKFNKLDENWYISQKLDGVRTLIHVNKKKNSVIAYSRNGKELYNLEKVLESVSFNKISSPVFLDGEVVYIDPDTGLEDFKKTIQIVRSSKSCKDNKNLYYKIFDMIPENEFYAAKGDSLFIDRQKLLNKTFKENKRIKIVEQVIYSEQIFTKMQDDVTEKGWEGLMLRKNVSYKGKRIRDLCKVKKFHDSEFVVKDTIFNKMRFINDKTNLEEEMICLAAVIIVNKGTDVKVGSGFSLEERKEYYKHPEKILGKKITVKFFEEIKDTNSLRFPIFLCIRNYE